MKSIQFKKHNITVEALEKQVDETENKYRGLIRFFDDMPDVRHNYSYFPIFINAEEYGMTRDELYFKMKADGVLGRRYFYPLISTFSTYRGLPSATPENLPKAHKMADSVICLPMHHNLTSSNLDQILSLILR